MFSLFFFFKRLLFFLEFMFHYLFNEMHNCNDTDYLTFVFYDPISFSSIQVQLFIHIFEIISL